MLQQNVLNLFGESIKLIERQIEPPVSSDTSWWCDNNQFYLQIKSVAKYQVWPEQNVIFIEKDPDLEDEYLINTWLYGTVFAYLLQYRDYLVLHGSAIMVNDQAIIFSGDSGAGKSTLAMEMVSRGYGLITDDVVAIRRNPRGELVVVPGPGRLKLWSDALDKFETAKENLQRVVNKEDKFELPVNTSHITTLPVAQFYELNHVDNGQNINMTKQCSTDKIQALIKNTYRYSMLKPMGKLEHHLQQVAELAAKINIYKVVRPHNQYLLSELADMIEEKLLLQ